MKAGLAALSLFALAGPASAAGGVWCDIVDRNLELHFKASTSRDGLGGWWGIGGSVFAKVARVPLHLTRLEIKDEDLTERWLGREGVLLEIQKYEPDRSFSMVLTVVTTPRDEGSYEGHYELRISDAAWRAAAVIYQGDVTCGAD